MKMARMIVALCIVAGVTTAARAEETKADVKKLIVGKWEAAKADAETLPVGSVVEFTADGKLSVMFKKGAEDATMKGTYKVDGGSFTYKLTFEGMEHSEKITVSKIDAKEMDTSNPDGKKITFKKVK